MMIFQNQCSQDGYLFREDDGIEGASQENGGATRIAPINADVSFVADRKFRLRFLVTVIGLRNNGFELRYAINGVGFSNFDKVTPTSRFVKLADTTFYTDLDESTDYVGRIGTGVWIASGGIGQLVEADGGASIGATTVLNFDSDEVETEWMLELVPADLNAGDVITLQLFRSLGTNAVFSRGYPFVPRITIKGGILDIKGGILDIKGGTLDLR